MSKEKMNEIFIEIPEEMLKIEPFGKFRWELFDFLERWKLKYEIISSNGNIIYIGGEQN